MPKKQKKKNKEQIKLVKEKKIKVVEPESILEREIAEEDRDLRKAKVADILGGFRKDREKRREELRTLMHDLKAQRIRRKEAMQEFMQNLRQKVLGKKKMMPEVRV